MIAAVHPQRASLILVCVRALVTGAAGFVGSHLADRMLRDGFEVIGVDNLSSGREENLAHLVGEPRFQLVIADACEPLGGHTRLDWVVHLASPASPVDYRARPLDTLRVNGEGTRHLLELAARTGAKFLLASSSEVYGDPEVHPQTEDYRGNVDSWGPRSVYQEAKRYAEALTAAHGRSGAVDVRVARIFNSYGPRMRPDDGRVVSTFVTQALRGDPITVHGDGSQTRSFQFVGDLVAGLRSLMDADYDAPVNLGSPTETSVIDLAATVVEQTGSSSPIVTVDGAADDPRRRCPDVSLARRVLRWEPVTSLRVGLEQTIAHFRAELDGRP